MKIRKEDILNKIKQIESKLGKLPDVLVDGKHKRVYIRGVMFTFEEFMKINIDKLFVGMPRRA